MPNQSSNQALLRKPGHKLRVHLTPLVGSVVWSGTISATPNRISVINLPVITGGGSHTAARRGMRVVIETPGGAYKGVLSIRYAGTISATILPVREFSSGHIEIASGDVFKVYNGFVLTDRLVAILDGELFAPDNEYYVDQNELIAPVGTSGGSVPTWVDEGQTYATVQLPGAAYTVDEDSSGAVDYLTTLPSGVVFAPGSSNTDASPTLRADVGYHVIEREFTDPDNGKTETQYVTIVVCDEDNPPYDLPDELTISGERGRGWSLSGVRLFENATLAALPDRSPIIVWVTERIDGTVQSIGMKADGRSHILCAGYLRRDVGKIDGKGNELTFDIISPLQRLAELPGFSKVLIRDASPDDWDKYKGLTVKRGIIQLLRYYTNVLQLYDLNFDGFSDAAYSRFYLQKKEPSPQVGELADSRDGILSADATGSMEIQQLLEYTPLDDRAGVPETIELGLADLIIDPDANIGVEIVRDHDRPVEIARARGFTAGADTLANNPLFGRWASSPGTGTVSPTFERMIANNPPTDFFPRTAMRGAWEDRIYIDANDNNKAYHAPEVKVTLPGSYRGIFQFYREYVRLDLDETTNPRGIDLSVFLFIVMNVEIQISRGTARVVLTLRAATYAEGAVDDTPEEGSIAPPEPPIVIQPPVIIRPPTGIANPGDIPLGTIPSQFFALSYEGEAARADSLNLTTGPDWEEISTGLTGKGMWACADPYNYFRRFALMSGGLYMCNDIWVASPTWVLMATNAEMFGDAARIGHKVIMSHNLQGWIMVLSGQTGCAVSFDYGGAWQQSSFDGGTPSWGTTSVLYYGDFANAHISGFNDISNGVVWGLYSSLFTKTVDWGLNWTPVFSTPWGGGNFCVPYKRIGGADNIADASQLLYYWNAVTNETHLYRSTTAGASWTGLGPGAYSNSDMFPFRGAQNGMNAYTLDGGILIAPRPRFISSFSKSVDAGANWVYNYLPSGNAAWMWNVNGFPTNDDFAIFFRPGCNSYGDTDGECLLTLDGTTTRIPSTPSFFTDGCTSYAEADLSEFLKYRG